MKTEYLEKKIDMAKHIEYEDFSKQYKTPEEMAEQVWGLLELMGYEPEEAAKELGMSLRRLRRILNGKRYLCERRAKKFERAFYFYVPFLTNGHRFAFLVPAMNDVFLINPNSTDEERSIKLYQEKCAWENRHI